MWPIFTRRKRSSTKRRRDRQGCFGRDELPEPMGLACRRCKHTRTRVVTRGASCKLSNAGLPGEKRGQCGRPPPLDPRFWQRTSNSRASLPKAWRRARSAVRDRGRRRTHRRRKRADEVTIGRQVPCMVGALPMYCAAQTSCATNMFESGLDWATVWGPLLISSKSLEGSV